MGPLVGIAAAAAVVGTIAVGSMYDIYGKHDDKRRLIRDAKEASLVKKKEEFSSRYDNGGDAVPSSIVTAGSLVSGEYDADKAEINRLVDAAYKAMERYGTDTPTCRQIAAVSDFTEARCLKIGGSNGGSMLSDGAVFTVESVQSVAGVSSKLVGNPDGSRDIAFVRGDKTEKSAKKRVVSATLAAAKSLYRMGDTASAVDMLKMTAMALKNLQDSPRESAEIVHMMKELAEKLKKAGKIDESTSRFIEYGDRLARKVETVDSWLSVEKDGKDGADGTNGDEAGEESSDAPRVDAEVLASIEEFNRTLEEATKTISDVIKKRVPKVEKIERAVAGSDGNTDSTGKDTGASSYSDNGGSNGGSSSISKGNDNGSSVVDSSYEEEIEEEEVARKLEEVDEKAKTVEESKKRLDDNMGATSGNTSGFRR